MKYKERIEKLEMDVWGLKNPPTYNNGSIVRAKNGKEYIVVDTILQKRRSILGRFFYEWIYICVPVEKDSHIIQFDKGLVPLNGFELELVKDS